LECAFGVVGKIMWIQNVGDIDFKVISTTDKIQINFKKLGFGRKNQLSIW
jgi:hypothetical protein